MRKTLFVIGILSTALWSNPTLHTQFPTIDREEDNLADPNLAWQIQQRITPEIDGQNIFSILHHSDGKSAIIGTTDFSIYRISLLDGSLIWKVETKKEMFRSTFFDAGELIAPSNDILVIGGLFSSGKFNIVDTKKGILLFASNEDDNYIHPHIFSVNPKLREVLALSSTRELLILRPQGAETPW